ncbi:MAG: hypothetical protein GY940_24200, partial [bacterium]|nr:hypothetical protein [bacterium]
MKKKLPILTFTPYITSNITLHVTSHFISRVISRVILGVMLFGFFLSPLSSQESRPVETGEPIIETVTVQNVEIPVRVFKVKQPVEGLQKTDFQLYINGKEHKISGFYQLRKKLDLTASPGAAETAAPHQPRLFVLIFNFSDYRQDLASLMDYFFSKVVQPGDRVMAITNHYFFPEWKADAPGKTKSQVLQVLQKEVGHLRKNMKWFENELKSQSSILKSRIADSAELLQSNYPAHIFKDFFLTYRIILDDIKTRFLEMPVSEYIKMADYIKSQPGDKWVFNFFQPARIPLMDNFGYVRRSMDIFINFGAGSPSGLVSAATLNSISSLYLPHLPGPAQANTTKLSPREILINPREMARHLKRLRFNYSTEMKIIAKDYLVN